MKSSLYLLSAVITAGCIFGAIAPFTPRLESLVVDKAYVREIDGLPGNRTRVTFITLQGLPLACVRGNKRISQCPTVLLKKALDQHTQLTVWHDGTTVYQAGSGGDLIIDYSKVYTSERWFLAFLAVVFSLPTWVYLGRRINLINPPSAP